MPRTGRKEPNMAEESAAAEALPEQDPQEPQGASGEDDPKPATDWKAEARKWESRAKENRGAAEELAKLKESQLADIEKAKAEAAEAKAEADRLRAEKSRAEAVRAAAGAAGVDADLLSLMAGDSPEEIEANAQVLKAKISALPVYPSVPDNGAHAPAPVTREEVMAIRDRSERIAAIAKNQNLFKRQ